MNRIFFTSFVKSLRQDFVEGLGNYSLRIVLLFFIVASFALCKARICQKSLPNIP